jgi:beta-D-xylosidase 4
MLRLEIDILQALHGVASSPGVAFNSPNGSNFSYATSFPAPILLGAAFDDPLVHSVASVIGKEARAFGNYQQSGYDFWTPNVRLLSNQLEDILR